MKRTQIVTKAKPERAEKRSAAVAALFSCILTLCPLTACGQAKLENVEVTPIPITQSDQAETASQTPPEQEQAPQTGQDTATLQPAETQAAGDQTDSVLQPDTDASGNTDGQNDEIMTTPQSEASSSQSTPDFYGSWQITDCLFCSVSALPQEEIDEFLACQVTYLADGFSLNGQPVALTDFGYTFTDYTLTELQQSFRVDLSPWQTGRTALSMGEIVSDEIFFGSSFIPMDADTLWIYYEGVFFRAHRV